MTDAKDLHVSSETKKQRDIHKYDHLSPYAKKLAQKEDIEKNNAAIFAAGQEDEHKGREVVKEQVREEVAQKRKAEEVILNKLDMKIKLHASYKVELAQALANILSELDWIRGWTADVMVTNGSPIKIKDKPFATKDGLVLVVTTPDGRVMHRAMLATYNPPIDFAGVYTIAIHAENTMDKERGLLLSEPATATILGSDGKPTTQP